MSRLVLAACLFAGSVAIAEAKDARFPITLQKPDARALEIIRSDLGVELGRVTPYPNGWTGIDAAWARTSNSAEPLLFVEFKDAFHCGNVNCEFFGLEHTRTGWRKIFEASGETLTVLASSRSGHRDILKVMHGGADEQGLSVYRWVGDRYRKVSTKEISLRNNN